jgi:hypothetical protein
MPVPKLALKAVLKAALQAEAGTHIHESKSPQEGHARLEPFFICSNTPGRPFRALDAQVHRMWMCALLDTLPRGCAHDPNCRVRTNRRPYCNCRHSQFHPSFLPAESPLPFLSATAWLDSDAVGLTSRRSFMKYRKPSFTRFSNMLHAASSTSTCTHRCTPLLHILGYQSAPSWLSSPTNSAYKAVVVGVRHQSSTCMHVCRGRACQMNEALKPQGSPAMAPRLQANHMCTRYAS